MIGFLFCSKCMITFRVEIRILSILRVFFRSEWLRLEFENFFCDIGGDLCNMIFRCLSGNLVLIDFFLFKNKNKNLENDVYIVIRIYVKQIFTRKVVYLNFELKKFNFYIIFIF